MVDDYDNKIEFTVNEQNCLALLCEIMSTASYHSLQNPYEESIPGVENQLIMLFDKFPNTNWGTLYDKFHRQGKNR